MLHYRGYTGVEFNRRIQACKKNWYMFHRFWFSSVCRDFKIILFRMMCVACLMSGVLGLPFTKEDEAKLDRTQIWYCRKLMQGAATNTTLLPDGTEKKTSLASARVLQLLRLAPVSLELRIQRLRWYRAMFRAPEKKTNSS
eukprot:1622698-Pyramimonas_sp.AAC.1